MMPHQVWKISKALHVGDFLHLYLQRCARPWLFEPWLKPLCISIAQRLFSTEHNTPQPVNLARYASLLRHFGRSKNLSQGKLVHAHIRNSGHARNIFLANLLLQMYGKCGAVNDALDVFAQTDDRNVFSWGIMIEACVHNQKGTIAVQLFHQMKAECVIPDNVTLLSILSAYSILGASDEGKRTHACIVGCGLLSDVILGTGLVSMYAKCGSLENSHNVFDSLHDRNIVTWNAMISAYAQSERQEAIQLFWQMQLECMLPHRTSFVALLNASGKQGNLAEGKWIHAYISGSVLDSDVMIGSALIHLYGRCQSSKDACMIFKSLSNSNVICWTAMMVAFSKCGQVKEAVHLLQQMDVEGITPDDVTYISLVDGCANKEALMDGKWIHTRIVSSGFDSGVIVGNALITMYGKCGSLDYARRTFWKMRKWDATSWNSIISAYAQNGEGEKAFELYQQMQSAGMAPNLATFSSVLSACCRAGLVDEGLHCFLTMSQRYGITPTSEHYNCMIDLLGRTGRLDEAEDLIRKMPVGPTTMGWMTLLGSSTTHLDRERAHHAAGCAFESDPKNHVPYVLLSNVHGAASIGLC